jgi:phosphoglycerol transferase MdoB-like AlkP superfamily enzyme
LQYIKNFFKLRINFGYTVSFLLILFGALALGFLVFIIQPGVGVFTAIRYIISSKFLLLFLNALPGLLLMLLIFFATNNIILSSSVVYFTVIVLSLINRNKIILREDPLRPWDLLLGNEVAAVFRGYRWDTYGSIVIFIIAVIILTAIAMIIVRAKKIHYAVRIGGALAVIIIAFFANQYIYKNHQINRSIAVHGNIYHQVNLYASKGFLYSFIFDYNTNQINKPENYDVAKIRELEARYSMETGEISDKKPNIIMILSEAFTELPNSPYIDFDGFEGNPIAFYNELKEESIHGYIIAPGFGGGTADTEFDILLGINTRNFRGVPYSNLLVTRPMDSVASVLKGIGYDNLVLHPGFSWFYNRNNVMPYIGFDKFIDMSEFDYTRSKGYYISEEATFDRIIEELDSHIKSEKTTPHFQFAITIQNHGPYVDKYLSETNFNNHSPMSETDINAVSNYFEGLKDADRELENLVEYMRASDEPIVLVYFGDHFPLLSSDACDALLPYDDNAADGINEFRRFRLPFIIWQNEAARKMNVLDDSEQNVDTISSFYLGAYLLELLGYDNRHPYFEHLNYLRGTYPVILENRHFDINNNIHSSGEIGVDSALDELYMWKYYRLFDGR